MSEQGGQPSEARTWLEQFEEEHKDDPEYLRDGLEQCGEELDARQAVIDAAQARVRELERRESEAGHIIRQSLNGDWYANLYSVDSAGNHFDTHWEEKAYAWLGLPAAAEAAGE